MDMLNRLALTGQGRGGRVGRSGEDEERATISG